jgi:hypothetical protein
VVVSSDWRADGPLWSELSSAFGGVAELLQPAGSRLTPERLVQAAEQGVPHADAAGLTIWPEGKQPRTIGPEGSLAHTVDQIQYAAGEGPCLDAATGDDVVRVDDLAVDPRWPTFSAGVLDRCSIRSMVSIRVQCDPKVRAALNFYARPADALSDNDIAAGAVFAAFISLALDAQEARAEAEHLRIALQTNRQIGTATGILMARGLLTSEQAFERLRQASQSLNRKLRDIARYVVETGELPKQHPPTQRRTRLDA